MLYCNKQQFKSIPNSFFPHTVAMKIILSSAWVNIHNENCESQCCSISKFSVY